MYKNFTKNTLTLAGGTYIAQVISLVSLPILSRMYLPEIFGYFAIYMAILLLLVSISSMRYEFAIVQAKNKNESMYVVIICILLNIFITCLSFLIIFFYFFFEFNTFKNIGLITYLIPFNLLFLGTFNILTNWLLKNNKFRNISKLYIIQNILIFASQIIFGLIGFNQGLIIGYFFGSSVIFLYTFFNFVIIFKGREKLSTKKLKNTAKKYIDLPKFSTIGVFADNFSMQAPIFFISSLFSSILVGSFNMVMKALYFPLGAISGAINNVLFKKISSLTNTNPELIRPLIIKISFFLFLAMLPFILIFWLFGPEIFLFILGKEWIIAGELSKILVIVIAVRFIVSSCNSVMLINKNIKLGVLWQLFRFCTITVTLSYFVYNDISFNFLMYVFLIHECTVYFIYFLLILNKSNIR